MSKKILIVASQEGFLIKGLETKLKGIGMETLFSSFKVRDLGVKCGGTDLIIISTDESIGEGADGLVYIKDRCAENDEQAIVIGSDSEYEFVKKYIPEDYIMKYYKRPLDMNLLIEDVEDYMDEDSQETRRKSILIVDDDVSYMTMIMGWLKDKYRISLANSGIEAITWLAKNHADLVLLDYEMPITPGPQVLQMIRSDATLANTPVMFLTGKGDKESVLKVMALKPVGYQLKTVDRNKLRENIAAYFDSQKAKLEQK